MANLFALDRAFVFSCVFLLICVGIAATCDDATAFQSPEDQPLATLSQEQAIEFFETQVKPVLVEKCFRCHNAKEMNGSLKLTSRQGILAGGDSGAAVDLESPDDSLLLSAIDYDDLEMPPTGKLPEAQIKAITQWVKLGMPWTVGEEEIEVEVGHKVPEVNETTKAWWSYQPVKRVESPAVKNQAWVSNEVDRFILAKLEGAGLSPNPEAEKHDLVRRVYYDLLGLPPTSQQVADYVDSVDPDAYSKLIDQLLQSPHYGEKWGRHWLDLVRYAETNSFERDGDKPFVWKYRDYVIRSFNQDKPYDQFVLEQLAGDELEQPTVETMTATGFYRLGQWDDEPADPELARFDDMDDILRTTSEGLLGMTVGCARCHDHKIDPIPQADYYKFLAAFGNVQRFGVRSHESVLSSSVHVFDYPVAEETIKRHKAEMERVETDLNVIVEKVKVDFQSVEHEEWQYQENQLRLVRMRKDGVLNDDEVKRFEGLFKRRDHLRNNPPKNEEQVLCVKEAGGTPRDMFVMVRGNAHVTGDKVQLGFPSVLSPPEPVVKRSENSTSTGNRLALAKWIVSKDNPLTARVLVNRIWQGHFDRGIVRTSSDFGFQGSLPTHPELLDWLASQLMDNGWKIKALHKQIMLSSAYKMSSDLSPVAYDADPANDLFWRTNLRRLTAEEVRDSILAVTGRLNLTKMFGPSIFPIMPKEVLAGQSQPGSGWGNSSQEDRDRRSVYIKTKRSLVLPILQNFDVAETDFSCAVRFNTTQPTQALGMLNSEFTNIQAGRMAKNILETVDQSDTNAQVKEVLQRVTQRNAKAEEISRGAEFIQRLRAQEGFDQHQALSKFCLLGLNLNEFIYLK